MLVLFFALYFYRTGAGNLEALFNYPFWRDMGSMMSNEDFMRLRVDHLDKVFPLLVIPVGLMVVVTATLAIVGAPPVPRSIFIGDLALQFVAAVSTVLIQFPIQVQLTRTGFDAAALDRLITTDLWFRRLPSAGEGVLVLIGLWRVVARRSHTSSTSRP